nr:30S ribosomal protein S8 [Cavernulicola chilensis]
MSQLNSLLSSLNNAYLSKQVSYIKHPYSNFSFEVCYLLIERGYLSNIKDEGVYLYLYLNRTSHTFTFFKPKGFIEVSSNEFSSFIYYSTLNDTIVSTSRGLITAQEAFKFNLGGTILFKIQ